jgi:hypothetical protein
VGPGDPENIFRQGLMGCRENFEHGLIEKFSAGSARDFSSKVWL